MRKRDLKPDFKSVKMGQPGPGSGPILEPHLAVSVALSEV